MASRKASDAGTAAAPATAATTRRRWAAVEGPGATTPSHAPPATANANIAHAATAPMSRATGEGPSSRSADSASAIAKASATRAAEAAGHLKGQRESVGDPVRLAGRRRRDPDPREGGRPAEQGGGREGERQDRGRADDVTEIRAARKQDPGPVGGGSGERRGDGDPRRPDDAPGPRRRERLGATAEEHAGPRGKPRQGHEEEGEGHERVVGVVRPRHLLVDRARLFRRDGEHPERERREEGGPDSPPDGGAPEVAREQDSDRAESWTGHGWSLGRHGPAVNGSNAGQSAAVADDAYRLSGTPPRGQQICCALN